MKVAVRPTIRMSPGLAEAGFLVCNYWHTREKSAWVAARPRQRIKNLDGAIEAFALDVDPGVPTPYDNVGVAHAAKHWSGSRRRKAPARST